MPITVPYSVLADGYTISGDDSSGYKASVPYLVEWINAFSFVNQVLGRSSAVAVGPITYRLPYRLPTDGGIGLYARSFAIEPCGASGGSVPNNGLIPGADSYFTHAKITVEFGPLGELAGEEQQRSDPNNLNQLDPSNPISGCKQSVKSQGKIITRKGGGYKFSSDGAPVLGDFGVRIVESSLTLRFDSVPYQPWSLVKDKYLSKVNDAPVLQALRGQLLLEGLDTDETTQTDGTIAQSVVLTFKHQNYDWNKQPRPDTGALDSVVDKDTNSPIYPYIDFRALFDSLSYSTIGG